MEFRGVNTLVTAPRQEVLCVRCACVRGVNECRKVAPISERCLDVGEVLGLGRGAWI